MNSCDWCYGKGFEVLPATLETIECRRCGIAQRISRLRDVARATEISEFCIRVEPKTLLALCDVWLDRPELVNALSAVTGHFADVMRGLPVRFENGVEGVPTIARARRAIAKAKA